MALYLSSYAAPSLAQFVEYRAAGHRACLIPTAANALEPAAREEQVAQAYDALVDAGLEVEVVDLDEIESADAITSNGYHVIALGPGDPFYLLKQARAHGLEYKLREAMARGAVIAGIGAGAVVLGPTINPLLEASQHAPEDGAYLEGLYLTETLVLPHHGDPRRAAIHAEIMAQFGDQFPVVPLHDGQAVIVTSDGVRVIGEPLAVA